MRVLFEGGPYMRKYSMQDDTDVCVSEPLLLFPIYFEGQKDNLRTLFWSLLWDIEGVMPGQAMHQKYRCYNG